MERKTGLIAALAGMAALGTGSAQAVASPAQGAMAITSYADLLRPVPNPVETLKASDAMLREQAANAPRVQQADWGGGDEHHHHHHHHHEYYAPPPEYYAPPPEYYAPPPVYYAPPPPVYYHHHHHHHHHAGAVIMLPGIGVQIN